MIYLNSAATSYPKPQCVIDAVNRSLNALPSAQFRSAGIFDNSDLFAQTRGQLAELFGIREEEKDRIFFTSGSTDALNRILFGLGLSASQYVTTATEHNSVLRPLFNLTKGEEPVIVPCDRTGYVDPARIEAAVTKDTKALVINHCSNVTGAVQDVKTIGKIAKKHGLLFILDVSQSAGCMPIKAEEWGVDALAFTGHKSLLGPQGTGGYYIRSGLTLKPLLYGGTGKDSRRIRYEEDFEYEVGTQNAGGIAGLLAAVQYVKERDPEQIHANETRLTAYLIDGLKKLPKIEIIGADLEERGPVVSLLLNGMDPGDAAYVLQSGYGIITRAGLQCAPLIHSHIGSGEKGTLRVSLSDTTTEAELDEFINAMEELTGAME